ncbi:hypothetical protein [Azospirillum baldaniorum]|nr:hypothetical protein [Azospirillum baldaniorum]
MDEAFLTAEGHAAAPRTRLRTLLTTIVGVIALFGVGLSGGRHLGRPRRGGEPRP